MPVIQWTSLAVFRIGPNSSNEFDNDTCMDWVHNVVWLSMPLAWEMKKIKWVETMVGVSLNEVWCAYVNDNPLSSNCQPIINRVRVTGNMVWMHSNGVWSHWQHWLTWQGKRKSLEDIYIYININVTNYKGSSFRLLLLVVSLSFLVITIFNKIKVRMNAIKPHLNAITSWQDHWPRGRWQVIG